MADQQKERTNRTVLIAVDGSEHSDRAFDCECRRFPWLVQSPVEYVHMPDFPWHNYVTFSLILQRTFKLFFLLIIVRSVLGIHEIQHQIKLYFETWSQGMPGGGGGGGGGKGTLDIFR